MFTSDDEQKIFLLCQLFGKTATEIDTIPENAQTLINKAKMINEKINFMCKLFDAPISDIPYLTSDLVHRYQK